MFSPKDSDEMVLQAVIITCKEYMYLYHCLPERQLNYNEALMYIIMLTRDVQRMTFFSGTRHRARINTRIS